MRRTIVTLAVAAAAAVPATAAARTLPHAGMRFDGTTSAKKLNGFYDDLTFLMGARTLREFSFGSLGCFGYAGFPVGVDPYGTSLVQLVRAVPVTKKGTFAVTSAKTRWGGGDSTVWLSVTLEGRFTSRTAAHGTISVVEHGQNGSCGPVKMTFTAKPGR